LEGNIDNKPYMDIGFSNNEELDDYYDQFYD